MESQTSINAYNDFLLYGVPRRFTKILAKYELFKQVINLPGDIVECGVFKGTGVLYWAKLLEIFNPYSVRRVVGFDTFEGYPSLKHESDMTASEEFIAKSSYTGVLPSQIIQIAETLNLSSRIELVKGDAVKTIPEYVKLNPGFRIALLNLDFDIYDPTIVALENLYPLVVPRGIITFDEYAKKEWSESTAIDEFFKGKQIALQSLPWASTPTAFSIKPLL